MALNFPSSPTNGQLYTSTTGVTYQYNGTYWNAINTSYATGGFRKIDNISSQFNGSNTTFYLNVSGIPTTAVNPQNLIISVGGITQEPGNAYTVSANTIIFTTAPSSGMSFFGTLLGDVANIGIPSDKTVGLSTLTDSFGSFVTSSYAQANTATTQAQSAYDQANTGTTQAQASFLQANNAYTTANTKFNSSGGTITGPVQIASSLIVTGNVTISGNVTTINANNLSLQDNMFYLNSGSTVANPDLGFAGNYNDGAYRHAGFFRDATDGYWKVFDSYLPEPDASPYIDTSNSSFKLATFQANNIFVANNVGIGTSSFLASGDVEIRRSAAALNLDLYSANASGNPKIRFFNNTNQGAIGYTSDSALAFYNNSVTTERMRLDASGNLGLGVTVPSYKMSIANTDGPFISFAHPNWLNSPYAAIGGLVSNGGGNTTGWLRFFCRSQIADASLTERYRINNDGSCAWYQGVSGLTQAMTLDASGRLIVGGTTPYGGVATFTGGSAPVIINQTSSTGYAGLRIYNDQGSNIRSLELDYSGSAYSGSLIAGGPTGESGAICTTGAYPLVFGTNNTARMTLNTNGAVVLQGGTSSASGVGISFPGTQSASSDANTLDDYEEGTYTPALLTASGTPSYLYQEAYYTKIGRQITCGGIVGISNSTSLTGTISISLPFPAKSSVYGQAAGCVSDANGFTMPIAGAVYSITFQINNGSSYAIAQCLGTGTTSVAYNSTNVAASWYLRFMVTYPTTT